MKHLVLIVLACGLFLGLGCGKSDQTNTTGETTVITDTTKHLYRFAFVGCNRVDFGANFLELDSSFANTLVLKKIINDLPNLSPKPNAFFFLGDMVRAESDIPTLEKQLSAWATNLRDPNYSNFPSSGIQMVAIPGNHEMLKSNYPAKGEVPLKGSIGVWEKHILNPYFTPTHRDTLGGPDWMKNRATYGFTAPLGQTGDKVAFLVINTDTYDDNAEEGQIPLDEILALARQYKNDPTVKITFALTHKPCYYNGSFHFDHYGFPDSEILFDSLNNIGVAAILSAHMHYYLRACPSGYEMQQVIAGNGGSSYTGDDKTPPPFFGYSLVDIYSDGTAQFHSQGFDPGTVYTDPPQSVTTTRDSATIFPRQPGNGKEYTGG